jgi:uncharacterized protein DUF222/HNH endonuclease
MLGELEQLGERIAEHAAHLDAATHRLLADLRDFDRRGGWHAQGALSCAHWLAWRVGWDLVTSRERVRVAGKLADFALIDDALRRGELSYSKVRALLRIASPANEIMILEHARLMTASQLEKLSRKYALVQRHGQEDRPRDDEQRRYVRRRDTDDGMVKIEAVLHPEEAELVWSMLDHAAKNLGRASPSKASARHDSAESPETTHVADMGVGAGSGQPHLGDDSAESRPAPSTGLDVAPLQAVAACILADSPEAREMTDIHSVIPAAAASREVSRARLDATPVRAVAACTMADSAEARGTTFPGVVAAPVQSVAACTMADSAESPTVPGRGLLDRLLDDVEVTRGLSIVTAGGSGDLRHATAAPTAIPAREPSVLHQQVDATRRAFNRADALLSVAQAYLRGDRLHRVPVEVTITIPEGSLRRDALDAVDVVDVGWMGDSCVSTETARRLSCDAGVIEVVEDEHGVPLSVGRKRRTIAGSIKRALLQRDTACTFPGCTHRLFLEGHHIKHWVDGGETSLENTSLLCTHHHRYVHEYGYTIELGPDQRPQFREPDGRLVAAVPGRGLGPGLGWPQIRAANEPLAIDAETIACEWDGNPVDYGRVVDELVVVDGLT